MTSQSSRSAQACSRPASSGAAPEKTDLSADRSYLSTRGCLARASTIGGATYAPVMRWSWSRARNCSRANRGMGTRVETRARGTAHEHHQPVDVEEREHGDQALAFAGEQHRLPLADVGDQVAVGEHDTLVQH